MEREEIKLSAEEFADLIGDAAAEE